MPGQPPYTGYPGQVWATVYQAMAWLNNLLADGAATASSVAGPVQLVFETARNGSTAIETWQNGAALSIETKNLAAVAASPITLDPTTAADFNNRITAVTAASVGISALPPPIGPFGAVGLLEEGNPAIPYTPYLEYCYGFTSEPVPDGLASPSDLLT
jgi:hypothetical protein